MAKGTLIAAMNIGRAAEDEFHDWYDTEHLPERQRVPGFLRASAGSARRTARSRSPPTISTRVAVLKSPAYLAIGGENLSPWSKRVTGRVERLMRFEGDQILPGDQLPPAQRRRAAAQRDEHRPRAGGRVQRVVRQGAHPRAGRRPRRAAPRAASAAPAAIASTWRSTISRRPDVVESAEWKQARQSDWTSRLTPHFRDHLRLVCRRYVRGA